MNQMTFVDRGGENQATDVAARPRRGPDGSPQAVEFRDVDTYRRALLGRRITCSPPPGSTMLYREPLNVSPDAPPHLFVIVDTEEEFDWNAPFSRGNTSVRAIRHVGRLQSVLAKYRVRPTYVVDFPIASQPEGWGPLKELADAGEAQIGAHLHPWVNPPYVEEVNGRNSYGCRLGATLEFEKIRSLKEQIETSFGMSPSIYKAGRYGFGPSTAAILEALDFTIDMSVNPRMDYTPDEGPSFERFDTRPFLFGSRRQLLEIPCSTDYTGVCGAAAGDVHRAISRPSLRPMRLVGVMARLGLLNKIMLSPEGSRLDEMIALTRTLMRRGVRTFSLTLHSPSVEPGCTPYVRTQGELGEFLDRISAYCEFFFGDLGGVPSTPHDFLGSLPSVATVDRGIH
jgi:hypothetical protein